MDRRGPTRLRNAVVWTALSLLAYFLIDTALFRSGWYLQFLEPESTAGKVEEQLHLLTNRAPSGGPEVLVMGDSRIAQGFSAPTAEAAVHNRLHFANVSVSGTTPRTWYYLIRDADPTASRFAAVVLPLDDYADQDSVRDMSSMVEDLSYSIGRLRITDCVPFARSVDVPGLQLQVLTGCLLRGIPLRQDVKDLLLHYDSRIRSVRFRQRYGAEWLEGYRGNPENVTGITADWANHRVSFPPRLTDFQKTSIQWTVMPPDAAQTGALTNYRKQWFGRILDLYRRSPTRIIFVETPRAPLPRPESAVPARFVESVRARAGVYVVSPNTFRDLERPELFADGFHLNSSGRSIFSQRLAIKVSDILGGH